MGPKTLVIKASILTGNARNFSLCLVFVLMRMVKICIHTAGKWPLSWMLGIAPRFLVRPKPFDMRLVSGRRMMHVRG